MLSEVKVGAVFERGQMLYMRVRVELSSSFAVVELHTGNMRLWSTDCEVIGVNVDIRVV